MPSEIKKHENVSAYKNVQVMSVDVFLVKYVDGHGQEEVQLGFEVGPEIRFLDFKALSKPAQGWLRDQILIAQGKKEEPTEEEEEPVSRAPAPTLERQI